MSGIANKTPIEKLSSFVFESRFEDFDKATVESAKNRIIDVLGCAVAGARAVGNSALVNLVKEWGGKEEATILNFGGKVPAHNAAMVNSIMARSFDFEPVNTLVEGIDIPCHVSGTTVMTAVSLGEMKKINGRELLTALITGEDFVSRVLAASNYNVNCGWDCTGTVNMIGATAIAGRLLGLNKQQMMNAFGIVLNQMAGSFGIIWDATTAFKLPQGLSARNGIFSAQLAKEGWTGPADFLLGKFGYYQLYSAGCKNPGILTHELGKIFYTVATFKPYPCCRGSHAAIDCVLTLLDKNDVNVENIAEVTLFAPRKDLDIFLGQPFQIGAFPQGSASFNYQYLVASTLLRKCVKPEHFSEKCIRDPQIQTLISKIKLAELVEYPAMSAKIKIKTKQGKEFSEYVTIPKGEPIQKPLKKDEIIAKFRENTDFSQIVSKDNSEKALQLLDKFEKLDNIDELVKLLVMNK